MSKPADPAAPQQSPSPDEPPAKPPATPKTVAEGAPVIWPRDLNAPLDPDPVWGTDPENLRHA